MELLPKTIEEPYIPIDDHSWVKGDIYQDADYKLEWIEAQDLCDTDLLYSYVRPIAPTRFSRGIYGNLPYWFRSIWRTLSPLDTLSLGDTELQSRFKQYVNQWRRETWFMSSVKKRVANLNYLSIISLGTPAIPLILKELERQGDHWFLALRVLTGEDIADDSTDFSQQRAAWVRWGRMKGYI